MTPPRPVLRVFWAIHERLYDLTRGRIGTNRPNRWWPGTLFLHTVGWRSGLARRNAVYYVERGRDVVVVASNAGEDVDPAWWSNLQAQPDAEIEMDGRRRPIHARRATEAEAAELWPRLDAAFSGYAEYRRRTTRALQVVILQPRETPPLESPPPAS
jgi:deazaflavin-dependent oxidoreductase (nitroreductase family)